MNTTLKLAVIAASVWLSVDALAATNLLVNADMSLVDGIADEQGKPTPQGWAAYGGLPHALRTYPLADGVFCLETTGGKHASFHQGPFTLRPGARYRYSAEVKTEKPVKANFGLQYINHYWAKSIAVNIPKDTRGNWQRIVWEGKMIESRVEKDYHIGFTVDGGEGLERVLVRNLCFEPLDEDARNNSTGITTKGFVQFPARIVPVDPLLTKVNADHAVFTLRWFGEVRGGRSQCTLVGSLGNTQRKARMSDDGRAVLDFGKITWKVDKLSLKVMGPDQKELASNTYKVAFAAPLPQGPKGRKLNNFVTELVNAPLANGEVKFFRAEDGWVWINYSDGDLASARGYLDDQGLAVVRFDPDDPYVETMRFVTAGWHTLHVAGAKSGSRLRIHAVGTLGTGLWGCWTINGGRCTPECTRIYYSLPFLRRFVLPANNTYLPSMKFGITHESPVIAYYLSRGSRFFPVAEINPISVYTQDYVEKSLMQGAWQKGNVSIDELLAGGHLANHAYAGETLWKMFAQHPERGMISFSADALNCPFGKPELHVTELAAVFNSGNGTGILAPELYAGTCATAAECGKEMEDCATLMRNVAASVPGAKGRVYLHMNPYMQLGHYTSWNDPEVDVRAFYSLYMQLFATDPRFSENAGIGGGVTGYCEEELVRWYARLKRYYGIEGGTEDLAKKFGFKWRPEIIPDGDFTKGLGKWKVRSGSVKSARYEKLGNKLQSRQRCPSTRGETVAEFTTVAGTPSQLAYEITGLEKGRFYKFACALANAEAIEKMSKETKPLAFSAKVEGAERRDDLSYTYRYDEGVKHLATVRMVFRATDSKATIVLEDRRADGKRLAEGSRQLVNFVTVRPYYLENNAEAEELSALLNGK